MKSEFSQPRFTGERFDEHTLPVDVARDLAAYERFIIELAKHLYLKKHPDRRRVPNGFESCFRLDIERIDKGSTKPMLALVMATGLLPLSYEENNYFENARDLIAECIAAPIEKLPKEFPLELLTHFNQFGRSLRHDETLELKLPHNGIARLTPEKRKQLVLAANNIYEREINLNGHIEEVDFSKSTFRLRPADGSAPITIPMPSSFHDEARKYVGHDRHLTNIKGIGAYNSQERLDKIVTIEWLCVIKNYEISMRFGKISRLENGWLDREGLAPEKDNLSEISDRLIEQYPEELPLPSIVPKQDGNLLLEWNTEGSPSIDIDLTTSQASYHAFGKNEEDIERDFYLDENGWESLFSFLKYNIKA